MSVPTTTVIASIAVAIGLAGPAYSEALVISGGTPGHTQIVGTLGVAHTFGPAGGKAIDADLRKAIDGGGTIYAYLENVRFLKDEPVTIELYLIKGWDWQKSGESGNVSFENYLGSIGYTMHGDGNEAMMVRKLMAYEVTNFVYADRRDPKRILAEGKALDFLKSGVKNVALVLLVKEGQITFDQFRLTATPYARKPPTKK